MNITRADVVILERMPFAAPYSASASYDLEITSDRNSTPVAHVLQQNEIDRFVPRLGFSPGNTSCGFTAQVVLTYNGDQETVSAPFTMTSVFKS